MAQYATLSVLMSGWGLVAPLRQCIQFGSGEAQRGITVYTLLRMSHKHAGREWPRDVCVSAVRADVILAVV